MIRPNEFWDLSWYDVTVYMAALHDKHQEEELKQELEWARTRAIWLPLMKANFKKEGGAEFTPKDLITLSFDTEDEKINEKPISFREAKGLLGSRIRKDGK